MIIRLTASVKTAQVWRERERRVALALVSLPKADGKSHLMRMINRLADGRASKLSRRTCTQAVDYGH